MRLIALIVVLLVLTSCSDSDMVFDCDLGKVVISSDKQVLKREKSIGDIVYNLVRETKILNTKYKTYTYSDFGDFGGIYQYEGQTIITYNEQNQTFEVVADDSLSDTVKYNLNCSKQ